MVNYYKNLDKFLQTKNVDLFNYFNFFFNDYNDFLNDSDYVNSRKSFYYVFNNLINLEKYNEESLKNLEINILATINYKNKSLKYFLTPAKYPDLKELKNQLNKFEDKYSILKIYVNIDTKNDYKLSYIEDINDFINSFAEMNKNTFSRYNLENENIEANLKRGMMDENGKYQLEIKFEKFRDAYNEISDFNIDVDRSVKCILNDDKEETMIYKLYCEFIDIQNRFLKEVANLEHKDNYKNNILVKNAIEQIKKEIPIQLATKADIFECNVKNNIILSFDELFSFYSTKNIFNKKNNKINYCNYSIINFEFSKIEKELINIILTGKKLFSKNQIFYQFYLDPLKVDEKTTKFNKFTDLYGKESFKDIEKDLMISEIKALKKVFLQNLEIIINYILNKKSRYQPLQSIDSIKIDSNLYLNQGVIKFLQKFKNITINKLISLYELGEELIWEFIADRYIKKEMLRDEGFDKYIDKIIEFVKKERERELKNELLTSLLVRFICRYLPYANKDMASKNLFVAIKEKNFGLQKGIIDDLSQLIEWGIEVKYAYIFTKIFTSRIAKKKGVQERKINESTLSTISHESISLNDENINEEEENEEEEQEEERDI